MEIVTKQKQQELESKTDKEEIVKWSKVMGIKTVEEAIIQVSETLV